MNLRNELEGLIYNGNSVGWLKPRENLIRENCTIQ